MSREYRDGQWMQGCGKPWWECRNENARKQLENVTNLGLKVVPSSLFFFFLINYAVLCFCDVFRFVSITLIIIKEKVIFV